MADTDRTDEVVTRLYSQTLFISFVSRLSFKHIILTSGDEGVVGQNGGSRGFSRDGPERVCEQCGRGPGLLGRSTEILGCSRGYRSPTTAAATLLHNGIYVQ